jgi:hypothetical protein
MKLGIVWYYGLNMKFCPQVHLLKPGPQLVRAMVELETLEGMAWLEEEGHWGHVPGDYILP